MANRSNKLSGIVFSALKKASIVGVIYLTGYYGVSMGWLVGPIILYTLQEGWNRRRQAKRAIVKAASSTNEQDVILTHLTDLPTWVFFPDFDRAEWINKIIKQIWPNVNHYVRNMIQDEIEPLIKSSLEKYKLFSFKLDQVVLGNVPFRIGGVKVYDDKISRTEIVMDLDVIYAGDCNVTFSVAGIKAGIRDVQLHGMLRVVMRPLITSIPLVGGVQVFFLNDPDIDFDLVGVADVLDLPGLNVILRKIVTETVAAIAVLPNKIAIKLSSTVEAIDFKASNPIGVLRCHLVEAKHLLKKDFNVFHKGKSDPYAKLCVGAQEHKTPFIACTVDPKWDYWCEFIVYQRTGQQMKVSIWDRDEASDDEFLGKATVDIETIAKKRRDDIWITLEEVKHGMVHLRFIWMSLSTDYSSLKAAVQEMQLLRATALNSAILTVFVDSAKNLPHVKHTKKPNPYVTLEVGHTKKQTVTIPHTIKPIWEQSFTLLVPNPDTDALRICVTDEKSGGELGYFTYNLNGLTQKLDMEVQAEPIPLERANSDSVLYCSLQLRILESPPTNEDLMEILEAHKNFAEKSNVSEEVAEDLLDQKTVSIESVEGIRELPSRQTSEISNMFDEESVGLGRIQLTLRYSVQRQKLIIVVHNVVNISVKDATASMIPDPYVKVYLLPERSKDSKRKTQVIKDSSNPIFDESFEYTLSQSDLLRKQLEVTVCTQKQLFYSSSNVLGQIILDLSQMDLTSPYNSWYDLKPEASH